MIHYSSQHRSEAVEIMDDLELAGPELAVLLTDLERINLWLGGNRITTSALHRLWPAKQDEIVVVDVGCGDGAHLRNCIEWARKNGRRIRGIGLDANAHIIAEARSRSRAFPELEFQIFDVFSEQDKLPAFDIALCTLFLHHLKNEAIITLLNRLIRQARIGIIVNDLHRHRLAFWAFRLFVAPLLGSRIARHDGAVSVARSFKRQELESLSTQIQGQKQIRWGWAFRWQWILQPSISS